MALKDIKNIIDDDDDDDDDDNDLEAKYVLEIDDDDDEERKKEASLFQIYAKNIIMVVITHLLWSFLPVFTRYLLVKAPVSMNSLVLLSSTKVTAFILIFLMGDNSFVFEMPQKEKGIKGITSKEIPTNEILKDENRSDSEADKIDKDDRDEKVRNENMEGGEKVELDEDRENRIRKKVYTGFLFSILTTCRAALGIECLKYTTATNTCTYYVGHDDLFNCSLSHSHTHIYIYIYIYIFQLVCMYVCLCFVLFCIVSQLLFKVYHPSLYQLLMPYF